MNALGKAALYAAGLVVGLLAADKYGAIGAVGVFGFLAWWDINARLDRLAESVRANCEHIGELRCHPSNAERGWE